MARHLRSHVLPAAITAAVLAPIGIALIVLSNQQWAPLFDIALIEQRVRDVGTARTPLLGLPGRLGSLSEPANHPGPLAFYLLAPVYRLLGGTAWALAASTAFFNAIAAAATVFICWRRGGAPAAGLAGLAVSLLVLGFGPGVFTEPWNPHLPVMWFTVFLAAVWAVLLGRTALMPVVVATGSICAQTHVPYVALCAGLGAVAGVALVVSIVRVPTRSTARREGIRWLALSCGLLLVSWLPPILEEVRSSPGNASRLLRFFTDSEKEPLGVADALPIVLGRLDGWHVLFDQLRHPGSMGQAVDSSQPSPIRGAVVLFLWGVCAAGAIRARKRSLVALHGMALAAIASSIAAVSRIVGGVYNHVLFWSWIVGVLVVVAIVATLATVLARTVSVLRVRSDERLGCWVVGIAITLVTTRSALSAFEVRPTSPRQAVQLRILSVQTVERIRAHAGAATGAAGRYHVSWSDPMFGGALGIGLVNELERADLSAAYERDAALLTGGLRVEDSSWGTARVHLAVGPWIGVFRQEPDAVEVAYADTRTAEEKRERNRLRFSIAIALAARGRTDLVSRLDRNLFGFIQEVPNLPQPIVVAIQRLTDLGAPAAVFIMPPRL